MYGRAACSATAYLALFDLQDIRSFARVAASSSGVGSVVDMMKECGCKCGQSIAVQISSPKSLERQVVQILGKKSLSSTFRIQCLQ